MIVKNVTKENRTNRGEVKWTKKGCVDVTCLFKLGFSQLIN